MVYMDKEKLDSCPEKQHHYIQHHT